MLVLNNISFEFGSRVLFKDASWHIRPGEKTGLIGANGTGKSTLLRIISGEYSISGGNITKRKELSIGFLNQDLLSYNSENSIRHVAMEAFEKENALADQIEILLKQLETDHSEELLHKLHDAQTLFDSLDGYTITSKAELVLEGLGFSTADLDRPLNEFSGGWRMRVMLAKILLQQPGLLLLDEPTNHLDLPSIQWLEDYLDEYNGSVVVVSHDRYFLDRIVNRIAEVSDGQINLYSGDYTYYLEAKHEATLLQQARFQNQQQYIKQQEKFINRFRAKASKATAVQSRIKALERLEKINDVDGPAASIQINFSFSTTPGKIITELDVKSKQYDTLKIFDNTKISIERGDKIALIGANGKGKSTLLRMIAGTEDFDGQAIPGYNVVTSFYAQHQLESLNLNHDLLEELRDTAPDQSDTTLRTLLGAFLFKGDDVFKKIKVLSGGEKSRVALAKTMLTKANFLLLDEPTNHLDIQSVNVLIQVLRNFKGSYIIVSHDRFFLAEVANKIWYIENKQLKEYPGTYAEYELWNESRVQQPTQTETKTLQIQNVPEVNKNEVQEDRNRKKQAQQLQSKVDKLESKLNESKLEKDQLLQQLSDPAVYENPALQNDLQHAYEKVEAQIKELQTEFDTLFLQLIELDS